MSARFLDFQLEAGNVLMTGSQEVAGFRLRVMRTPRQQSSNWVDVALGERLRDLVHLFSNSARGLDDEPKEQNELAGLLGDALLPEGDVRNLYRESVAGLQKDEGLRVRLKGFSELAGFPWEFAGIPDGAGATDHLFLDVQRSLVWDDDLRDAVNSIDPNREPAKRLVYAAATPGPFSRYPHLPALAEERTAIVATLGAVRGLSVNDFPADASTEQRGVTIAELTSALSRPADVLHFSGHGEFADQNAVLVLSNDANEYVHYPSKDLGALLRGSGVKLVVLGACQTAAADPEEVALGMVRAVLRAGVPAVLAMRYAVRDDLTAKFTAAFYMALAAGRLLDEAVTIGRRAAKVPGSHGAVPRDWASPVLHLRCGDLAVFPSRPAQASKKTGIDIEIEHQGKSGTSAVSIGELAAPGQLTIGWNEGVTVGQAGPASKQMDTTPDISISVKKSDGLVAGVVSMDFLRERLAGIRPQTLQTQDTEEPKPEDESKS